MSQPASADDLAQLDAYWRAANYLSVGQIYLLDNPLLREPLRAEHVKPRLLGHWGTTPGLNLLYAHMNRAIRQRDLNALYVTGPGHGGPGLVANAYLEGTYSEVYSSLGEDVDGMRALFRQFSFPGGIPSHVAPETPGSIHEGGELGYALVHAYGAVFDNPDLLALCVVGDGEAETGPLAASWHSNKFLDPRRDGVVLPVLHLNGYKIANPTVLARIPDDELASLLRGYGHTPHFVVGDEPSAVHQELAATLDTVLDDIAAIKADPGSTRPAWPMIVLRTPKGWTGPKEVDGKQVEGTFRAHQVPLSGTRTDAGHRAQLEEWMRSYRPEELFDADGRLVPELRALAPEGDRRMSANPHANGGRLLRDLAMPDFRDYAVPVETPAAADERGDRRPGRVPPGHRGPQRRPVPALRARRGRVQPAAGRVRGDRPGVERHRDRRGRPPRSGRPGDGDPLRAPVPGLARGLPADRTARPVHQLRGVRPHRRLDAQPARQVAQDDARHPVAGADRVTELPALLARLASGPQRVLAPGPGLPGPRDQQEGGDRPGLPPAGHQHPAVGGRPLPAQQALHQRHRRGEAAAAHLPDDGPGDRPLHPGRRHLGVGREHRGRAGRRPRRARGTSRPWRPSPRRSCCASTARSSRCGW